MGRYYIHYILRPFFVSVTILHGFQANGTRSLRAGELEVGDVLRLRCLRFRVENQLFRLYDDCMGCGLSIWIRGLVPLVMDGAIIECANRVTIDALNLSPDLSCLAE